MYMSEMEVILEKGQRSTLSIHDGALKRTYNDTGAFNGVQMRYDANNNVRVSGNRTLVSLLKKTEIYRGIQTYTPKYLQRVIQSIPFSDGNIDDFAFEHGVQVSTMWCYLSKISELEIGTDVLKFVYPPLLSVILLIDTTGSLKTVMTRLIEGPLQGDTEWRCVSKPICTHSINPSEFK